MPVALFDSLIGALGRAMSLRDERHQVLASNLANVETPGYRARELDFANALRDAFAEGDSKVPGTTAAAMVEDKSVKPSPDGNTVDVDLQMMKLSENAGAYRTLARFVQHEFEDLKMAIDKTT